MFRHDDHARSTSIKLQLTVSDLASVQRVLMMLTSRTYAVTRFEADAADAGRWRVSLDCTSTGEDPGLLQARLLRIPSVLTLTSSCGSVGG